LEITEITNKKNYTKSEKQKFLNHYHHYIRPPPSKYNRKNRREGRRIEYVGYALKSQD
jgi:hypothetical protein